MKNLDKYFDYLVETGIATENEIELVTSINGWKEESFDDILYVRTGYRDFEQIAEYDYYAKLKMKNYNKMTWVVYKNGKEENIGEYDKESVKDELIQDLISVHFYKNAKASFVNYDDIKIEWTETIGKTKYKTIRKYTEEKRQK